jgi:RNA polymerase sigma factor (TIGR02999 family)
MAENIPETVSVLVGEFRRGEQHAAGRLVELLYPDLRRLAQGHMNREKADHTWQPTALVNELFMELVKVRELKAPEGVNPKEKEAFLGFASHLMRRLLVGHARRLYRRVEKTHWDETSEGDLPRAKEWTESLAMVRQVLDQLEEINPRLRSVVELRVFEGLSGDEIAERLGCTRRTVVRDWTFARQMLATELDHAERQ